MPRTPRNAMRLSIEIFIGVEKTFMNSIQLKDAISCYEKMTKSPKALKKPVKCRNIIQ